MNKPGKFERIDNDPLTQVPDKKSIERRLRSDLETNSSNPYSVILFDLDFFKYINDQLGHKQGDAVLKDVGTILNSLEGTITQYAGLCGRYGGEEFLITAPHATEENVLSLAEKIRQTVDEHRFTDIHDDSTLEEEITISLGVNVQDLTKISTQSNKDQSRIIIDRADIALSYSKLLGKNRVSLFNEQVRREMIYLSEVRQLYFRINAKSLKAALSEDSPLNRQQLIRDMLVTYVTHIQGQIQNRDYRTKSGFADNLYREIRQLPCEEKKEIILFLSNL